MTLKDKLLSTPEGRLVWHQERTIFETTNLMCEIMDEMKISRVELAKRLGRTKGYVTQLLDGSTNMTLRTVSDVFLALGCEFHPAQTPLKVGAKSPRRNVILSAGAMDFVTVEAAKDAVVLPSTSTKIVHVPVGV